MTFSILASNILAAAHTIMYHVFGNGAKADGVNQCMRSRQLCNMGTLLETGGHAGVGMSA